MEGTKSQGLALRAAQRRFSSTHATLVAAIDCLGGGRIKSQDDADALAEVLYEIFEDLELIINDLTQDKVKEVMSDYTTVTGKNAVKAVLEAYKAMENGLC